MLLECLDSALTESALVARRKSRRTMLVAILLAGIVAALVLVALTLSKSSQHAAHAKQMDTRAPSPPLPPPLKEGYVPMEREKAQLVNASIPVSKAPLEVARPFILPPGDLISRQTATDCLTAAIYYEAASESIRGQKAVAQVVLNRVRHPAFPKSVCGVVYQGAERSTGCQFTFTCDGSLARKPSPEGWLRARQVALASLAGAVEPSVGTATHYHTIWVVPYWAWTLDKVTNLGAHIFYRWPGYWGRRAAFSGTYAGDLDTGHAVDLSFVQTDRQDELIWIDATPKEPALRADERGQLAKEDNILDAPAATPRADSERGSLVADEISPGQSRSSSTPTSATRLQ